MTRNFSKYWISGGWLVTIDNAKEVTAGSSVHTGMAAATPGPARWWGSSTTGPLFRSLPSQRPRVWWAAGGMPSIAATFGGATKVNPGGRPWPPSSSSHAMTGWVDTDGHPRTESHPSMRLACWWWVSAITDWTRKKGVPIHERMVHALSPGALRRAQSALGTAVSAVPPSS